MPCLSLWALNMNKFMDPLMNHLAEKANFHILNSNRQKHQTKKVIIKYIFVLYLKTKKIYAFIRLFKRLLNHLKKFNLPKNQ